MEPINEAMRKQLTQDYVEGLQRIRTANRDLGERMTRLGVRAVYDAEDDFFAIIIGETVEATTESIDNTLLVRVDPDTQKIVGFEVYDFEVARGRTDSPVTPFIETWAPVVEALRAGKDPHDRLGTMIERTVQELVPAG